MQKIKMPRQYFETKVWVRDRIVVIADCYLAAVGIFIIVASLVEGSLSAGLFAIPPFIFLSVLLFVFQRKNAPKSGASSTKKSNDTSYDHK